MNLGLICVVLLLLDLRFRLSEFFFPCTKNLRSFWLLKFCDMLKFSFSFSLFGSLFASSKLFIMFSVWSESLLQEHLQLLFPIFFYLIFIQI